MGVSEIRTAAKVDLKKPADQQEILHVCPHLPTCSRQCD